MVLRKHLLKIITTAYKYVFNVKILELFFNIMNLYYFLSQNPKL